MSKLQNAFKYQKTVVLGDEMVRDFGNEFIFVSQSAYKGKPGTGLKPGATIVLQIVHDHAEPGIDKETGVKKDNNVLNTFEVTVPGVEFPLSFAKGDRVSLGGFMPDHSYYINFAFILRFSEIKPFKSTQTAQPSQSPPSQPPQTTQPTQSTQTKSLSPKS